MKPRKALPLTDYTIKLMLLEAITCYASGNRPALEWLEHQLFVFTTRLKELEKRGL